MLLGVGNPLLDMHCVVDDAFFQKYNLNIDDTLLAKEAHNPLFDRLLKHPNMKAVPGGGAQNVVRLTQRMLHEKKQTVFMGSVGNDVLGRLLAKRAEKDGIITLYQKHQHRTGACAVLIHHKCRKATVCARLDAATLFTENHLQEPQQQAFINKSKYFYVTSFFLLVCPSAVHQLAQHSLANGKIFMMNLSAAYLMQSCREAMLHTLPYVDIIFGNETEAKAFGKEHNFESSQVSDIALQLSSWPKLGKERLVVITQGPLPAIVAYKGSIQYFHTSPLTEQQLVDTNGAGDAFVAGFVSQLMQDKQLSECMRAGHWAAGQIIRQIGCVLPNDALF